MALSMNLELYNLQSISTNTILIDLNNYMQ